MALTGPKVNDGSNAPFAHGHVDLEADLGVVNHCSQKKLRAPQLVVVWACAHFGNVGVEVVGVAIPANM